MQRATSPRRSSRARTSQPAPPTHTNSTTSSTSLTRAERNTRSLNKTQSPHVSPTRRSESMDDADSNTKTESLAPRRSRRGNDSEKDEKPKQTEEEDGGGEALEEDITRCICGQPEYPGPPASIRDFGYPQTAKVESKEENGQVDDANASDTLSDDVGNFFIQCDNCHVWQHGGCVGLTDESLSPEFYYCEECKPEFHKVIRATTGSKSTRYLPVLEASPNRSSSLSSQDTSKGKDGRLLTEKELSIKRRATMNSRTAYDEDEMLRRAIEESKEMGTLGKRLRDDSEDLNQMSKRQRTFSSSPSTLSKQSRSPSQPPTSDQASGKATTNGSTGGKKVRGVTARSHRDKEVRDRQKELSVQRAEAASKRAARSERRRGEDSPPPTPEISPSKLAPNSSTTNQKGVSNDILSSHRPNPNNHRKTGRPPARRGRLGRNQYTRDLPLNGEGNGSPMRDDSNGPNGQSGSPPYGTRSVPNGINGESGRNSRPKYHNPTRTSMNEMKRRVAAILEFVNRMQTEKHSQRSSTSASASDKGSRGANTPSGNADLSVANMAAKSAAIFQAVEAGLSTTSNGDQRRFVEMPSSEMMDTLMKELVQWQSLFGKHGEK